MSNVAIFKLPPEERPESETHLRKHLARVAYFETAAPRHMGLCLGCFYTDAAMLF
jgi:hypothetical protein